MVAIRSILFNAAFYVVTAVMLVGTLPVFFFLPQNGSMVIVRNWARVCVFLHEAITGVHLEVRGQREPARRRRDRRFETPVGASRRSR